MGPYGVGVRFELLYASTRNVSPGRVGFGHASSPPKPMMPLARGRPPVTKRRMATAAVCQPLADSPRKTLVCATASSRWKG